MSVGRTRSATPTTAPAHTARPAAGRPASAAPTAASRASTATSRIGVKTTSLWSSAACWTSGWSTAGIAAAPNAAGAANQRRASR
jgi:hypothetical protein